jgi:acyl carrier protein
MGTDEKLDRVRMIVADILAQEPGALTESSGVDVTPEWDSLRHLAIMTEVEQQFGHRFELDDILEARTISAIVARLP